MKKVFPLVCLFTLAGIAGYGQDTTTLERPQKPGEAKSGLSAGAVIESEALKITPSVGGPLTKAEARKIKREKRRALRDEKKRLENQMSFLYSGPIE